MTTASPTTQQALPLIQHQLLLTTTRAIQTMAATTAAQITTVATMAAQTTTAATAVLLLL